MWGPRNANREAGAAGTSLTLAPVSVNAQGRPDIGECVALVVRPPRERPIACVEPLSHRTPLAVLSIGAVLDDNYDERLYTLKIATGTLDLVPIHTATILQHFRFFAFSFESTIENSPSCLFVIHANRAAVSKAPEKGSLG